MVYSSSRTGTRSLIKTAVLCAVTLSVIPSTFAAGSLDSSSSADVCGISDGDKSVGIRVIDDSTCASGGLGCYNDHCRFCKVLATSQSSSFQNCTEFGVDFPTMAPLIASTGTCEVSSGDAAVGISAITDPTCLYGGLGCFNDHCRFCKQTSTAQSDAFVDCTGSNSTDGSMNSTDGSMTDAPVDTATSASSTSVDNDGCTLVPGAGDVEVGISIGTDPTCSAGGLGCINNVCRFCRIRTTMKSATYRDCSLLGMSSSAAGSSTAGVTDTPTETPAATTVTPSVGTDAPTATTAMTETPAPDATTEAPSTTTNTTAANDGATTETPATKVPASTTAAPAAGTTCSITASVGDATVGINIVTDSTCSAGGVGCIDNVCRFCKVTTSIQSADFLDCSQFAGSPSTSEVPTADNSDEYDFSVDDSASTDGPDVTTKTPAMTTEAPTETPSATTAAPKATTEAPSATTEIPAATTAVPDATTEAPSATTETPAATTAVSDATTEAPVEAKCTQTVSDGDAAVGINIVTDASCSSGGTGCIDDICRFCKVTTSTQSAAFVDCPSITKTAEAPTETEAPTESPTEAPTGTGASTETEAPTEVPTDAPTETEAPTEAPTDAPTEAPTDAPTETEAPTEAPTDAPADTEAPTDSVGTETPTTDATCSQTVSEGDASVGINIVTDNSCSAGGVGCIDSVCRFCKVTDTEQSSAFVDCSEIAGVASGDAQTNDAEAFNIKQTRAEAPESKKEAPLLSQYQTGGFVAGCVVAVAAVALVARAAKKATSSNANPNEPSDDDNVESGRHVSPGPVPTQDDEESVISAEA